MFSRSTSVSYTHFVGDLTANVDSSHGVQLTSFLTGGANQASTGGVVQAFGDDANIALTVRGQGTGLVNIGNSSQAVNLPSSQVTIGQNSTTPVSGIQRYLVQFTPAVLAVNAQSESTITVTGLTTNAVLAFTGITGSSPLYLFGVRCSTAAELKLNQYNGSGSTIGSGESTSRGTLIEFRF